MINIRYKRTNSSKYEKDDGIKSVIETVNITDVAKERENVIIFLVLHFK